MKISTNFIENFDQDSFNEYDNDFDAGFDDTLFEQLEEVASEDMDFSDLENAEEDDDNFDGVF